MNKEAIFRQYPAKRLAPDDGMVVTASEWNEAHEEHRLTQRLHTALERGPGIVTGLDVVASDPPETSVYVLPGVAISPDGNPIVVREPVTYDLRVAQGVVILLLTYEESPPRVEKNAEGELSRYIHAHYTLEAVAPGPDTARGVELARFYIGERGTALRNAARAEHPDTHEIDMRFRQVCGAAMAAPLAIAVCAVDDAPLCHEAGWQALARFMRRELRQPLCLDLGVPLTEQLHSYPLVILAARGEFSLPVEKMNALYTYLQQGGAIWLEACCQEGNSDAALTAFQTLLESLGVAIAPLPEAHALLESPYLFAAPPAGAAQRDPQIWFGDNVILSSADYGCLWAGQHCGGLPAREQIRTAHEWGANLLVALGHISL